MASGRLVDYLGSGIIADRPASLTLAPDSLGLWWATDTSTLSTWDGTAWADVGGGGVADFTDLGDVPASYVGEAGKVVAVNVGETGLEFIAASGTGTVTSVDLANSTGLTASGGPITAAGSLTYTLSANLQAWHGLATSAKQDADSDLTDIAALTPTNDDILQRKAGAWTNRTMAQLATDLTGVVHTTGTETIAGAKTFTSDLTVSHAGAVLFDLISTDNTATQVRLISNSPTLRRVLGQSSVGVTESQMNFGTGDIHFWGAATSNKLLHLSSTALSPDDNNVKTLGTSGFKWSAAYAMNYFVGASELEVGTKIIPQNSKSAAYTLVLADSGGHIFHPSADTTARIWTIPANASVAYPIGTALTFINQNGAGVITIAITSDTMRLAGAGTTGSRTLAANGVATAIKITATEWIISGTGLT